MTPAELLIELEAIRDLFREFKEELSARLDIGI
jgi:hypothetical protein